MRGWPILLLIVVAGALAAWVLLGGDEEMPLDLEPAGEIERPRPPAGSNSVAPRPAPAPPTGGSGARIGVLTPADRAIPTDPSATPLEQVRVRLPASSGGRLAGEQVLAALAEPFLVRARRAEDLPALRADTFELEGGREVPLPVVVRALQAKGYFVRAREGRPVFVVGRLSAEERARMPAPGDGPEAGGGLPWKDGLPASPGPLPSGPEGGAAASGAEDQPENGGR